MADRARRNPWSPVEAIHWHPRAGGWMVGRAPNKAGARAAYWCGPDHGAGYSATTSLRYGSDALVWSTPEAARIALLHIFRDDVAIHLHGFVIVPVRDGVPAGPYRVVAGRTGLRRSA